MLPKTMADESRGGGFDIHKLTILLVITLLTLSSVSAQFRKPRISRDTGN